MACEDRRDHGPLIDAAALAKVEEHVADAHAKGGKVMLGGKRARARRHFLSSRRS